MTYLDFLNYVISYWKKIEEEAQSIMDELDAYEGNHRQMAFDYATSIVIDAEEWKPTEVLQAQAVIDEIEAQVNEETQLIIHLSK